MTPFLRGRSLAGYIPLVVLANTSRLRVSWTRQRILNCFRARYETSQKGFSTINLQG